MSIQNIISGIGALGTVINQALTTSAIIPVERGDWSPGDAYDGTHARLEILSTDSYARKDISSTMQYIDFILLQQVNERLIPRFVPTHLIGNKTIFTRGKGIKVYSYVGVVLHNKTDGDLIQQLRILYQDRLRADAMVANGGEILRFSYRDQVRWGYIQSMAFSRDANNPRQITVAFSLFVTKQA